MNYVTTELLKQIGVPRTKEPVQYSFKPIKERWYINAITWDIKPEIATKYGVRIEIEQGSLYYRGTWLTIRAKSYEKDYKTLDEITKQFCSDYGFDRKKRISFGYVDTTLLAIACSVHQYSRKLLRRRLREEKTSLSQWDRINSTSLITMIFVNKLRVLFHKPMCLAQLISARGTQKSWQIESSVLSARMDIKLS